MGKVIRQDETGVEVKVEAGKKRKVKHFGGITPTKVKIPDGMHGVVVPMYQHNGVGLVASDYEDMGYEVFESDANKVGRKDHVLMICPIEDYEQRLQYVEKESEPTNRTSDLNMGDPRYKGIGGNRPGKQTITRGKPIALGGEEFTVAESEPESTGN